MIQRIIKVGNDLCVSLPSELTESLKFKEGTEVSVTVDSGENRILIQLAGQSIGTGEINPEFTEQVSTFIRDYKPALAELAKLEE